MAQRSTAYRIEYSPEAEGHLRYLTKSQQTRVLDAVDRQLADEPTLETRHRKKMRPNPIAPWELRIGDLRVYYEVEERPRKSVNILAVGEKDRNTVRIAREIIEL
jgi:mRNA-degrading endonuclease RelE of RelBE toxin-antitoxin system